jgi:hypothetical protein
MFVLSFKAARLGGGLCNKKPAIDGQSRGFLENRVFLLEISSHDADRAMPHGDESSDLIATLANAVKLVK